MSELEMNPYVVQIDKFVTSLGKLSDAFLNLEEKRTSFTEEEYQEIVDCLQNLYHHSKRQV